MPLNGSGRPGRRAFLPPAAIGLVGVLTAAPGVHAFEQWLAPRPALLVSHGLAAGLLGVAFVRWRVVRRQAAGPASPAV